MLSGLTSEALNHVSSLLSDSDNPSPHLRAAGGRVGLPGDAVSQRSRPLLQLQRIYLQQKNGTMSSKTFPLRSPDLRT